MNTLNQTDDFPVSIENLDKAFQEGKVQRQVFSNLQVRFRAGICHAIVGRSGSGKSTLLNLIAGIDIADKGSIRVAGSDLDRLSEHERTMLRRRHIGIVFQFFNLIPSLTVKENVMLPLELNGFRDSEARARAALDEVGMAQRLDSYPDVLSGGEQQRVAIARAVVHKPQLILADEPTGNLDEETAQQTLNILFGFRQCCTVIFVTHSLELAQRADCIWYLKEGGLHADGIQT